MSDEWCLIAQLDGDDGQVASVAGGLAEALGQMGAKLTRDRGVIRVYSDSEQAAAEAEQTLLGLLDETALGYELWQERWDPEKSEWEELAPDLDDDAGDE